MAKDMSRITFHHKIQEAELCVPMVKHLEDTGWTVYQEVPIVYMGQQVSIDIVAVNDKDELFVVEAKAGLGDRLYEQATRWLPYADFVSVLTTEKKHTSKQGPAHLTRHYRNRGRLVR